MFHCTKLFKYCDNAHNSTLRRKRKGRCENRGRTILHTKTPNSGHGGEEGSRDLARSAKSRRGVVDTAKLRSSFFHLIIDG